MFKPGARPQPASRTWFTEIVLQKVCLYVYLFVCPHPREQSFRSYKSSLYARNKGYTEPVLNL